MVYIRGSNPPTIYYLLFTGNVLEEWAPGLIAVNMRFHVRVYERIYTDTTTIGTAANRRNVSMYVLRIRLRIQIVYDISQSCGVSMGTTVVRVKWWWGGGGDPIMRPQFGGCPISLTLLM